MLESQTYSVFSDDSQQNDARTFLIIDALTGASLGSARERSGLAMTVLRRLIGVRLFPSSLVIHEKPDDSLLASLSRSGFLFEPRLQVLDALGSLVGYFPYWQSPWSRRGFVFDRLDQPVAEVVGQFSKRSVRFVAPSDRTELAVVNPQFPTSPRHDQFPRATLQFHLQFHDDLDDQPLTKMLILAVTLAATCGKRDSS